MSDKKEDIRKSPLAKNTRDFVDHVRSLGNSLRISMAAMGMLHKQNHQQLAKFADLYCDKRPTDEGVTLSLRSLDFYNDFKQLTRAVDLTLIARQVVPETFLVSLVSQFDAFVRVFSRDLLMLNRNILKGSHATLADPTDDPTHGAQQLSFFNGHYDTWCYLPMMGFVSFNDEPEQYLCAAVLRPGNVTAAVGAVGILRRLLLLIHHFLPGTRIRVRLDGGFAHPEVLALLDAEPGLEYVVAMAKNAVLKRKAKRAMRQARKLALQSSQTEHVYDEARYAARSWPQQRRILIKAEVVRAAGKKPKDNPRFVITNMQQDPQWLYEQVYCKRGEVENRIKELHDLQIDRTSCSDFWANQFRVLLTAAAYVLMQEVRLRARGTGLDRAQVWTLRERLLKLGAQVLGSVRRVVLHLPASFPYLPAFRRVALELGASPG